MDTTEKPKRPHGRPVEKPMPEPIADTPGNTMRAILATPGTRDDERTYLKADPG